MKEVDVYERGREPAPLRDGEADARGTGRRQRRAVEGHQPPRHRDHDDVDQQVDGDEAQGHGRFAQAANQVHGWSPPEFFMVRGRLSSADPKNSTAAGIPADLTAHPTRYKGTT